MGTAGNGIIPWTRPTTSSYPAWETALLKQIGAPVTKTNLIALNYWAASENTPASQNNWLALGDSSSHITSYASMDQGVQATAKQLQSPDFGYPQIVAALRRGNSLAAIWGAINASQWCSGCQGGKYPTVLANAANPGFDLLASPIYHNGATTGGPSGAPGKTTSGTSFTQCHGTIIGTKIGEVVGINAGPSLNLLDACQAKALVGAGLVFFGANVMIIGAVILGVADVLRGVVGGTKSAATRTITRSIVG